MAIYGSRFSIDKVGEYYLDGSGQGGCGGYGLILNDGEDDYNNNNILGIFNSQII